MDFRDTLERLVPDQVHAEDQAGAESLGLHLRRYEFAAEHARPGRLLDLACGVGYGTRLLADQRTDLQALTGVDLSPGAIGGFAVLKVRFVPEPSPLLLLFSGAMGLVALGYKRRKR